MSTVTTEIEFPSSFPANKVFKLLNNFDKIAPKVNPEAFKSIETIEGDGGVGTVRLVTFGDGLPFTSGKQRVDSVDLANNSYSFTFFEGDNLMGILDSITHDIKISPSGGGSVMKQTIVYNCKGDNKPSEEALKFEKEALEKTYKAIEAYGLAHLEA